MSNGIELYLDATSNKDKFKQQLNDLDPEEEFQDLDG